MGSLIKHIEKLAHSFNNYHWFLFFVLLSIALRFFSFFPSMLDHDESTYMIIGRDILNGKILYTDVYDTKPVGIFLFYDALEALFGSSIFIKRLVFAFVVSLTSYFIYLISKKLFNEKRVAVASGIIYIFYVSIWNSHGRSPNTELLFNLFTVISLFLFLKPKYSTFFMGGLAMGIGFMVKYVVLFDLFAFLLFFFILEVKKLQYKNFWQVFVRYALACFSFILPFAATNLYFWMGDHFNGFYYATYEIPMSYGASPSLKRYVIMILEFAGKFLPITFLFFYTLFSGRKIVSNEHKWFLGFWLVCAMYAIYLPGKEMSHYAIQLMLPISFITGFFFHNELRKDEFTKKVVTGKTGWILLLLIFVTLQTLGLKDDFLKKDYHKEVANYLEDKITPNDKVYVSNYEQIIYYLLHLESPTKYVHSTLLFSEKHSYIKNREKEIKRILNQKPKFVLMQYKNDLVESYLNKNYHLAARFKNGRILVYRRND